MTMRSTLACLALLFGVTAVNPDPAFAQARKKRRAPAAETKAEPAPEAAAEPVPEPVSAPVPAAEPAPESTAVAEPEPVAVSAAGPVAVAGGAKKPGLQRGILLELEPYFDDITDVRSRKVYGMESLQDDEREIDESRSPAVSVSATFMAPINRLIRLGGGFRYMSSYRYEIDPPEDDPNAEPVEENLGRMIELYGRAEVLIPLVEKLDLVPVLELGLPLLFPGGELQRELDAAEAQGFNVSSAPRLGILVGGDLVVRYSFATWFAVRGGVGIRYERLFLYNASTDDNGGEMSRHMNVLRFKPTVGVEFGF